MPKLKTRLKKRENPHSLEMKRATFKNKEREVCIRQSRNEVNIDE
jgi:hypothetical protein